MSASSIQSSASSNGSSSRFETVSSASLNAAYPPISTLERQYAPPLGQRRHLFLRTSPHCYLEGGVESILKMAAIRRGSSSSVLAAGAPGVSADFETTPDDDFDAFTFLNEGGAGDAGGAGANAANYAANGGSRKKSIGGFFRKVAATTTATLERQMQGLAVRMDQGRNSDLLTAALYDSTTLEVLGVTNSVPMPSTRDSVQFGVPLTIPGNRTQQSVIVKLWIQSGAALLQSTKAAKNYLLGSAIINMPTLPIGSVTKIPITSNLIVNGYISVCAMPDPKFARILTRAWSLTDPDMTGYSSNLHHLPLDQSYMVDNRQKNPLHWLTMTERAAESTVILPIAAAVMEFAGRACYKSLQHTQSVANLLRGNRHDCKDVANKANCRLGIVGVQNGNHGGAVIQNASISINWRRPDSIFELELAASARVPVIMPAIAAASAALTYQFFPKLVLEQEDLLHGYVLPAAGYLIGAISFSVQVQLSTNDIEVWETVIVMESFVDHPGNMIHVPLYKMGQVVGQLLLQLQVQLPANRGSPNILPVNDGLVAMMGLDCWAQDVSPRLDSDVVPNKGPDRTLRHQQLATMGYFYTTQYMEQHLTVRQSNVDTFHERARAYRYAMTQPAVSEAHAIKSPKPFRPSSSRMDSLLSGIPFNAHVVTLNLSIVDERATELPAGNAEFPGTLFHNVTCGAPSDHARGFGNVLDKISGTNVSGGLRRLEAKRWELAQQLQQAQSLLIAGVGNYLGAARQHGGNKMHHVPARHAEIQGLRWRVFECVHNLHHVTWICAVRRANVFSQSLGLAISSYLTSISDIARCQAGWPEYWKNHGYLISFEGLLSAAGKELGMIEDASVAIAMLRNVRVVLMPDKGMPSKAVPVTSSAYLKWINLFETGKGGGSFLLQIGVDAAYYQQRIPAALQNNTAVQFYPLLFQVGVDIRQWGAHAGSNILKQRGGGSTGGSAGSFDESPDRSSGGGIIDDDDDETGIRDDDVLVALNYEALHKLNAYAHAINPQSISLDKIQSAMVQVFAPQYAQQLLQAQKQGQSPDQQEPLPVHPSLSSLHAHVVSSAGKMNHSILDEAATTAQQLGGGGVVFCKSGKDRTAMQITYKQAQFAARYRDQHDTSVILNDATLLRTYGTRLPICEKNVGQAKYAFNSLQVKLMPEALKPPMSTLAGFLKGGRFFGEGAIES